MKKGHDYSSVIEFGLDKSLRWKLHRRYLELGEMKMESNNVRTTWKDAWENECNQLYIFD